VGLENDSPELSQLGLAVTNIISIHYTLRTTVLIIADYYYRRA
jgi:hypothetical protein